MEHLTDQTYATAVEGSELPVVLDFGASWCGPCKKLEPMLEEIAGGFAGKARFFKIDVEDAQAVAQQFGVMGVPTVVFLKEGKPVHRFSGVPSKDKIIKMLEQHFGV